ncbi:MAG: nuclear transport factor 2 family protein [Acidimicrobiales bacterium]
MIPTDADTAWLLDRTRIVETVYRYATGIDLRDWELYRSIFAEQVTMDFSSWNGRPPVTLDADEWVADVVPLFEGLDATQHTLSQPIVEIDGDRATCTVYMKAEHFLWNDRGDDWHSLGGYYTDTLVRTDAGWRIDGVTLTVLWNKGNRGVLQLARERTAKRAVE